MKKYAIILSFILELFSLRCYWNKVSGEWVSIIDKGSHYSVVIDFSGDPTPSHMQVGAEYGEMILRICPNYESYTDSYISEICSSLSPYVTYNDLLSRVNMIKGNIDDDYREEIDGLASEFSGAGVNVLGDGKISLDELYIINVLPDIARVTACCGLSVYSDFSKTGDTITACILDWYGGSARQLNQTQAVLTIKNGDNSIYLIGYLGFMGVVSGFNDDGVFAGILDSGLRTTPIDYVGKSSFVLDLRYALENNNTLNDVAAYMRDTNEYSFNHNILLADRNSSAVLENNLKHRALRYDYSELNTGITWGYTDAICVVNSFVLKGSDDNHTSNPHNYNRWNKFKTLLNDAGEDVDLDELKKIISYGDYDGRIFNNSTQHICIFNSNRGNLEMYFKPAVGDAPSTPNFEEVKVNF